jgi:cytoskeletal protein RodZ
MSQDDLYINGELLRLGRESRGWLLSDMATRACMSVKQIRQLEEGGTSAFYSPAVKMTSAKKLAGILDLSPAQVFNRPEVVAPDLVSAAPDEVLEQKEDQSALAQVVVDEPPATPVVETPAPDDVPADSAVIDQPKSKTSLWTIVALFISSLGVAAYLQRQEEPSTEPPPPLQVVPAEADASASAADAASSGASVAADQTASPAASSTLPSALTAAPASAPTASKPAASAASKPL